MEAVALGHLLRPMVLVQLLVAYAALALAASVVLVLVLVLVLALMARTPIGVVRARMRRCGRPLAAAFVASAAVSASIFATSFDTPGAHALAQQLVRFADDEELPLRVQG
jgi:membrane-anchored protein YejM (alkaline phosphatase superfamily)